MRSPVSVCHDKRRITTTGENKGKYPIKIKVNFKILEGDKTKYVVRRYHIHPDQVFAKEGQEYKKKKNDPSVIIALAKAIELHKKGLSVDDFERLYVGSGTMDEIKTVFDIVITELRAQERDGTADSYQQAINSFIVYKGEYITFGSITKEWLMGYERWCLDKGLSINTVGIYTRALRTIINYAIDPLKIIPADVSPFGRRKYIIPSGKRKTKKAFTREEKTALLSYRSKRDDANKALDFWGFQFFGNGCNMADVAYMKFKHIDGDIWAFERKKTENTERDKQTIDVWINDWMREVIAKYGNKSLDPDSYVFPILEPGLSSKQRKSRIHDFIDDINQGLAIAQEEIDADRKKRGLNKLTVKLTTGTARYTAATLLKKHGIDLATIAKTLGHGSEATTERYTEEERDAQRLISKVLAS